MRIISLVVYQLRYFWDNYVSELTSKELHGRLVDTLVLYEPCPSQITQAQEVNTVSERSLLVELAASKQNNAVFVLDHGVIVSSLRGLSFDGYFKVVLAQPLHFHFLSIRSLDGRINFLLWDDGQDVKLVINVSIGQVAAKDV